MSRKKFALVMAGLGVLLVLVWFLLPADIGIKSQLWVLWTLFVGIVTIVMFIFEILVALLWPVFLGLVHPISWIDDHVEKMQSMKTWQKVLMHLFVDVIVFFLGIFVVLQMATVPPLSEWVIGPFIKSISESYSVWFGVYTLVAYTWANWFFD